MSIRSSMLFSTLVMCLAAPLAAQAGSDKTPEAGQPIKSLGAKKLPKKPKSLECQKEETGKQICRDNGYGDQVCEPEIIERCPQPL